jgi:hypothetical protein
MRGRPVCFIGICRGQTIAMSSHVYINHYVHCRMFAVSSARVGLQSEDDDVLDVMLHATDGSVECNIFHIASSQVEIDGAPAAWVTETCKYDCIELPCQHKFNAGALALHFLTNHMTCPLCRHGVQARMVLACVPENIKSLYLKHITRDPPCDLLEFDPEIFLRDLRLRADFMLCCTDAGHVLSLTTPCIAVHDSDTQSSFRTHQSFRRHFNHILKTGISNACRFSLLHPLIFTSLSSDFLSCDEICGYDFSLPHEIAHVSCTMQHDILTPNMQLNLAVLYSLCATTVMQFADAN